MGILLAVHLGVVTGTVFKVCPTGKIRHGFIALPGVVKYASERQATGSLVE